MLDVGLLQSALTDSFKKFHPKEAYQKPVLFVTWVGTVMVSGLCLKDLVMDKSEELYFSSAVGVWLWITLFFANFAESIAEGRGKAQAESLKKTRTETPARLLSGGKETQVSSSELKKGDRVVVFANEMIPADGAVIEGAASVDESPVTGESAPVIREAGGDRSAVTGGTMVLSDRLVIEITSNPGESFLDKMIGLIEGATREKTPNELALGILLSTLTLVFLMVTTTIRPLTLLFHSDLSYVTLVALLVCLIPTTIGSLLSAIGIAGMDRLVQKNVLALSGRAVEAAGDIDVLLMDKTGTITLGNRMATEFLFLSEADVPALVKSAYLASYSDLTPEGRSILKLAEQRGGRVPSPMQAQFIAFSAETRMSGVDWDGGSIRKGSLDSVQHWVKAQGGEFAEEAIQELVRKVAVKGGTPLVVAQNQRYLGVIYLKDVIKPGMRDRFERIRAMGIKTIMITGDNRLTAEAIAREAGVDDFLAEAKPEDKLALIQKYQAEGKRVAMSGDGTNDAPALAQSDVGLVMNTGTQSAREAGNMIDLDSDPTKIIEIVEIGKQLLITRGALTTFSIANDVSKYFAILPAIFLKAIPGLGVLNIMALQSPNSAILSAIIFNALIIPFLIPLALRGVVYRPQPTASLLRRNLSIYGGGGMLVPFVGIKGIDLILATLGWK